MDYIQAFKDGHIIVQISTNEEANHLYGLCGDNQSSYSGNDCVNYPYVIALGTGVANGYAKLERARNYLTQERETDPVVLSYEEFSVGEPEPETQYDDLSSIL